MKIKETITWLTKPEPTNFPAAHSYLSLLYEEKIVKSIVKQLKVAPVTHFKAKDIFRASGLSLLGVSNTHIDKDKKKIKKNTPLSPILLVRDGALGKVIIADGYHRMCAVYIFDEDAIIPCLIV